MTKICFKLPFRKVNSLLGPDINANITTLFSVRGSTTVSRSLSAAIIIGRNHLHPLTHHELFVDVEVDADVQRDLVGRDPDPRLLVRPRRRARRRACGYRRRRRGVVRREDRTRCRYDDRRETGSELVPSILQ